MKTFAIAASAAILLAGVSLAAAQTQVPVSPANINKGATTQSATKGARISGSESKAAAKMHAVKKKRKHVTTGAKKNVPLSPANINKGTQSQGARKSGNEPNSMAR